jgi:hypothetical protein
VPDGRCPQCGLPEIFPPSCLGIETCNCQSSNSESRTRTLGVRFSQIQAFTVNIIEGEMPLRPSARSHQSTFSGRTLLARNGNPCRLVWEASPRAHGGGLRAAMPRPRRFNFPWPPAPAEVKPKEPERITKTRKNK